MKKDITIQHYNAGLLSTKKDTIVQEEEMTLIINQSEKMVVSISPEDLRPFGYGFLLTSGLIEKIEDITEFILKDHSIFIQLKEPPQNFRLTLASGCGSSGSLDRQRPIKANTHILWPNLEQLPELFKTFNHLSDIYTETGGIHSAAITDGSKILFFAEDIGRHNAVDKVIGKALLNQTPLHQLFLLTSGRISGEILKKVFYAGLRTVISRSAPTCAAIKQARRAKIGIVGFLRGKRFNMYT